VHHYLDCSIVLFVYFCASMRIQEVNKAWHRANRYRIDREKADETIVRPVQPFANRLIHERLDIAEALDALFVWSSAHERAGAPNLPPEKQTRRRQRADRELIGFFDRFGQLRAPARRPPSFAPHYIEGSEWWDKEFPYYFEYVDDIEYSAFNLRVFARRVAGQPTGNLDEWAIEEISEGAARVRRNPETLQWQAPSLWSLLCVAVLNYEDLGWGFRICAVPDCDNAFVATRSNRTMCSQRCRKRMWAQKQAEVNSVR